MQNLCYRKNPTDLYDWEVILGSALLDGYKAGEILDGNAEDGSIKPDYFALDSGCCRQHPSEEEENSMAENPSWIDPGSDSRFLEAYRGKSILARRSDEFWSDESSDGLRSLPDGDQTELENLGESAMNASFEETEGKFETGDASGTQEMAPFDGSADSTGVEKRGDVWWKMPLELLKFCIFRVRPAWSISIAAAMVGIAVLGRKLYRMKHKSRIIPLRIDVDDKKTSLLAARSARLKAISLVRYMPLIRPSLPANGPTQWAALPLR